MRIMMVVGFLWMLVMGMASAQEVQDTETAQDTQEKDFSKNNIRLAVIAALQDRGMEPLDLDFSEGSYWDWQQPLADLREAMSMWTEDLWRAYFRVSGKKHLLPHDLYYSCWVIVDVQDRFRNVSYTNSVEIAHCSVSGVEHYSDELFLGRVFLTSELGVFDHESWNSD